jgi:hypothetical protein
MSEEMFFFDDFFVSEEDQGAPVEVEMKDKDGKPRTVKIHLKRGISLRDREAAKKKAIRTRFTPDGRMELVDVDDEIFTVELLVRLIKEWPFKYGNGQPVKISRENITLMLANGADELKKLVLGIVEKEKEAHGPFAKPSDEASTEEEAPTPKLNQAPSASE